MWCVRSDGGFDGGFFNDFTDSYGKDEAALMHQILIKYWWLRSPSIDYSNSASRTGSGGDVYYRGDYVAYSYGRRSPFTNYVYYAHFVWLDGDVYYNYFVGSSHGRTISPDSFMYYNYTSFYVIEDGSMIRYAVEYFYRINKI